MFHVFDFTFMKFSELNSQTGSSRVQENLKETGLECTTPKLTQRGVLLCLAKRLL